MIDTATAPTESPQPQEPETPLDHLARLLAMPAVRVVDVYAELNAESRIAPVDNLDCDGLAVLLLVCMVDPEPEHAVSVADALGSCVCRYVADPQNQMKTVSAEEYRGGSMSGVRIIDATARLLAGSIAGATQLDAGYETKAHGLVIEASVRIDSPSECAIFCFSGPAPDEVPERQSGVIGRNVCISPAGLPELRQRMNCLDLAPASNTAN